MIGRMLFIASLALLVFTSPTMGQDEPWNGDGRTLKDVLLLGFRMPKGGIRNLSGEARPAAASYRERQERFRSRLTPPPDEEWFSQITFARHVAFERVVWSLFDAINVGDVATDFVKATPLPYEWEGMSEGPTAEAEGAERYLAAHPDSAITPYLHLFIAHRRLCAATFLGQCQECQERDAAMVKFRSEVALARQAQHPLIRFVARELENRPACYDE